MEASSATDVVDYCKLMNDSSLPRWERSDAKHHCMGQHEHGGVGGIDNAVRLLGGFLGAADHAVNSEMAVEATDPSYGDYHQPNADPTSISHAHNMQHSDIAMRAISEMLGFSHQMMAPAGNAGSTSGTPAGLGAPSK
jgi:hypothetical protein